MQRRISFATGTILAAALGAWAASISGTVRTSAAAGATGTPVEGAKVVLIQATGGGGGGGTQVRLDSVTTDAEGKYTFAKVDTGTRILNAIKEGYQNGTGFVNVASDTGAYTVNLTLRPPPDTTPGRLEGTVRKVNAQGDPIAGATVVVTRTGGGAGGRADTLTTDSKGHYAIDSLPPAGYSVRVSATGYANGTANATVRARDTTVADLALLPEGASGSISGKVVKLSDGSAVSGATVVVSRGGGGGGGAAFQPDTVSTGADGAYKFDSLPVQNGYTVTVKAAGFQSQAATGLSVAYQQNREANFSLIAAVADDTTHGSVTGVVTDSAHKALAGVRVILSRGGGGGGGTTTPIDTVETDANGRFLFAEVTAQTGYRLALSLTGYQNASSFNVNVSVGQTAVSNFTLMPATAIRAVAGSRLGLRWAAAQPGRLRLEMPAASMPARIKAYDARGALRFAGVLPAGATGLEIPWQGGKAGYVVVERGGKADRLIAATAP